MQYRPEIDGLRAIAVLPVILFHAGFSWFSGGFVGVDVFFVISGYLITSLILADLGNNTFSIVRFYERRARRILPALFFVILCCIPFALILMTTDQLKEFSRAFISIIFFVSNIFFWKNEDYFAQPAEENPLLHTWSLAVEEQFYIFFPLLLLGLWRCGRKSIFLTVIIFSLLSLALSEWAWRNSPVANFYLLPTRSWELGAGAICAFLLHGKVGKKNTLFSSVGFGLIIYSIFFYGENTPFPSIFTLAPVIGTALVILYGFNGSFVATILKSKIFVVVGLISYSAYLWHQPLFAFARIYSDSSPSSYILGGLSISSLIFGYLSWKYVELPFRNGGRLRLGKSQVFISTGLASLFLCIIGTIGILSDGLPQRLTAQQRVWEGKIEALKSSRQEVIKAGVCHFNGGAGTSYLARFLEQWDCRGKVVSGKNRIAIYGDSHSADKAVALRSVGVDPLQIGGSACPLIKYEDRNSHCNLILDKFMEESKRTSIDTVILANQFSDSELNKEYMREVFDFWATHFENVFIFTPMPEFPRFDVVYSRLGPEAGKIRANFNPSSKFSAVISEIKKPESIEILITSKYYCGSVENDNCSSIQDGVVMLTDYGHLSHGGARIFGERLEDDLAVWQQLLKSSSGAERRS